MTEQHEQRIVRCLKEAHALELALVRQLQAQIAMTPRSSYRDGLEDHLEESHGHARRLETRLGELGQGHGALQAEMNGVPAFIEQAWALTKTRLDLARDGAGEEQVLENAKLACAAEAQEIASYTALARLARRVGDDKTQWLAISILGDEQRMLDRLLKAIPRLTDAAIPREPSKT